MGKKLMVEGIAVVEGVSRNGVMYEAQELHRFAPSLIGRPILCDHVNSVESVVGKVTNAESIDGGKKVRYSGWIKDNGDGVLEKINDGRIMNVSIGAQAGKIIKESDDADYVIAKNLTALELSLTPVPGIADATIFKSEEKIKEMISEYMKENKKITEEIKLNNVHVSEKVSEAHDINVERRLKMESKESNKENIVVENAEAKALREQLANAEKQISEFKEAQRLDAVKSYQKVCAEKKLVAQDVSKMTLETIKALTAQAESIVVEMKVEAKVEEKKEVAMPKSAEIVEVKKVEANFKDYVIESSELGGLSFYKNY